MGIRVHKVLGYGLTDLKAEKFDIIDERINPAGMLGEDRWESDEWSRSNYLGFLNRISTPWREQSQAMLKKLNAGEKIQSGDYKFHYGYEAAFEIGSIQDNKQWEPGYSLISQLEYGLPNVLVIIPPSMEKDWRRYDDPIDYTEETQVFTQVNRVISLSRGLYPWDFSYMDSRTGVVLETEKRGQFIFLRELRKVSQEDPEKSQEFSEVRRQLVEKLGFSSEEECEKFTVPIVPESVQYFCEFGKIFTDPLTVFQLRPLIYVYWS